MKTFICPNCGYKVEYNEEEKVFRESGLILCSNCLELYEVNGEIIRHVFGG